MNTGFRRVDVVFCTHGCVQISGIVVHIYTIYTTRFITTQIPPTHKELLLRVDWGSYLACTPLLPPPFRAQYDMYVSSPPRPLSLTRRSRLRPVAATSQAVEALREKGLVVRQELGLDHQR